MIGAYIFQSWAAAIPMAFLLGIGLAMDAFGISVTHGFKDPNIGVKKAFVIASVFGIFQGIMPLIGWSIMYGLSSIQSFAFIFSQIVPPLALVILGFIGGKMIYEYAHKKDEIDLDKDLKKSFVVTLILQGIATSIDALSSGLAMTDYNPPEAGVSVIIICFVTFVICLLGVYLGKKFGNKAGNKAELIGGIILIVIGVFIFIKGEIRANAPNIIPDWLSWLI